MKLYIFLHNEYNLNGSNISNGSCLGRNMPNGSDRLCHGSMNSHRVVFRLKDVTCLTKQIARPRRYMQYTEYEAQKGWEKKKDSDVNA